MVRLPAVSLEWAVRLESDCGNSLEARRVSEGTTPDKYLFLAYASGFQ